MSLSHSILIPSLGRPESLRKCLQALNAQTVQPDEVIVCWQGSDVATRDSLEQIKPLLCFNLRIVHHAVPGIVPAENAALDAAGGEIILFIDDDAVAPPDWIARHMAHYEDPTIGAVGGPAVNHRLDGSPFPTRSNEPIGKLCQTGRVIGNMFDHPAEWRSRPPIDVDHLVGYNMSLRRSAFDRFEPRLKPYWQMFELDACLQARSRGFRVRFDFANLVDHFPTNTVYVGGRGGDLNIKIYNAAYNHAFILAKHRRGVWQRAIQRIYGGAIGTVGVPGLVAALVATFRFGHPARECSIFWNTAKARRAGRHDAITSGGIGDVASQLARESPQIILFATKGAGSNEERRMRTLAGCMAGVEVFAFDRTQKIDNAWRLLKRILAAKPKLVLMEGTGVAGGLAVMAGRLLVGAGYVVSSGDAVGPWVAMHCPALGPIFALYERVLYRMAEGFIGWTPYLVGRALSFGTPHAMTAAGWAEFELSPQMRDEARQRIRQQLGIPADSIVFGIVGSLVWSRSKGYCYGMELVRAMQKVSRPDVRVLIVGEGNGVAQLREAAAAAPGERIILAGAVPATRVPDYLAAMDIGSLPQSVDRVGSFRFTTKLSEYLAAGLPIVTGQIPLSYDLDGGDRWIWRLPGNAPWDRRYIDALAELMQTITPNELAERRKNVPQQHSEFDREMQVRRATEFFNDLLAVREPDWLMQMPKRLAILCDYAEENWPSMDLAAEMLAAELRASHATDFDIATLQPTFKRRATKLPMLRRFNSMKMADRLLNRMRDYPKWLSIRAKDFDLFHIADHSYSQLVHILPADRTGVFCHDLDTFRCLLDPKSEPWPKWFRNMTSKILAGMQKARVVFYSTNTVREQILLHGLIDRAKLVQAPCGIAPEFNMTGTTRVESLPVPACVFADGFLLHVGSCIPRKRIDVLLDVFARISSRHPKLQLVQVGGEWSKAQRSQLQRLDIEGRAIQLPRQPREVVAELYRRCRMLLLTSEAEGFGLPLVEALACGAAVVASDIPVLREIGGEAVMYCALADVEEWADKVDGLISGTEAPPPLAVRLSHASNYTWAAHAAKIAQTYKSF